MMDALFELMTERSLEIEQLKAENARLREALEHIAKLGNLFEERASAQVASEALKGVGG
jgi:cell shape-determining protein MreC